MMAGGKVFEQKSERLDHYWDRLEATALKFTKAELGNMAGSVFRRLASLRTTKGLEIKND